MLGILIGDYNMKNIHVKELNLRETTIRLERETEILKELIIDENNVLFGGMTIGSFAKGNNGPASDLDVSLFYKRTLNDILEFGTEKRIRANEKYKASLPEHPLLYEIEVEGKMHSFDIGFMPILKAGLKNGLFDSFREQRIHDMINFLYGKVLCVQNSDWLDRFRKDIIKYFNWDTMRIQKHACSMCASQLKKLDTEINNKKRPIRALKLLTTGFYIAFNSYNILNDKSWYQSIDESIHRARDFLGEHLDFFVRANSALKRRTPLWINGFKDMAQFQKAAVVLTNIKDALNELDVVKNTNEEIMENMEQLNKQIQWFYNLN